jgi:Flp pilus assembly pilin Flp
MWGRHRAGREAPFTNEKGQVLIEYALVLALIAIVSIGALDALGVDMTLLLHRVGSQMASVSNP